MSCVYFHTPHETVHVSGSERKLMGQTVRNVAAGVFGLLDWKDKLALLPEDWRTPIEREGEFGIAPRADSLFKLLLGGHSVDRFADGQDIFDVVLNTALLAGGEPLRFLARCHGQCESHGYVEPEHAEWLAGVIEEALDIGMLRRTVTVRDQEWQDDRLVTLPTSKTFDQGWGVVIDLLRSTSDPVVTSYSVSDTFPDDGKGWHLAMAHLRGRPVSPQWYPQDYELLRLFGNGRSAFDYVNGRAG